MSVVARISGKGRASGGDVGSISGPLIPWSGFPGGFYGTGLNWMLAALMRPWNIYFRASTGGWIEPVYLLLLKSSAGRVGIWFGGIG